MKDGPRRLDDVLKGLLKQSPLNDGLERQEVLSCWPEVVGTEIARHSRAVSLQDGLLLVQVDGSVWAQELALLRNRIVSAFAERLGDGAVREIRFHSGGHSGR